MGKPSFDIGTAEFNARFFAKCDVRGKSECWPWTARSQIKGYGAVKVRGKSYYATHIALMIAGVNRPEGTICLHSCDNKSCVNPAHLRWGTIAENTAEAVERGQMHFGERSGGAKLTWEDVTEIRSSPLTQKALAEKYEVSAANIWAIVSGKSWRKDITGLSRQFSTLAKQ